MVNNRLAKKVKLKSNGRSVVSESSKPFNRPQLMQEVQESLWPEINILKNFGKDIDENMLALLEKRLTKPSVRSYFIFVIAKYARPYSPLFSGKINGIFNQWFGQQLPFIIETIMTIMYLHNQIYDGKYGVNDSTSIRKNIQAANLLERRLTQYINHKFNIEQARLINQYKDKMLNYVDIGQGIEQEYNHYDSYTKQREAITINEEIDCFLEKQLGLSRTVIDDVKRSFTKDKHTFIENYFKRISLTTASLFILGTELVCELLDCEAAEKERLINFVRVHSLMRQVVNDATDFTVGKVKKNNLSTATAAKKPEDCCCDLKNKNITLPLAYHLKAERNNAKVLSYLEASPNEYEQQKLKNAIQNQEILTELVQTKAIFKAMKVGSKLIKLSEQYLNFNNANYPVLWSFSKIGITNKFYVEVFKMRECLKAKSTP